MDFLTILSTIRVPGGYIEFNPVRAAVGAAIQPSTVLIWGQTKNAGNFVGTTANGVISPVTGGADADAQFGMGSMLAEMVWTFFQEQPNLQVSAIGLADNGAGAAATGKITVNGPATAAGSINLLIAGGSSQRTQTQVAVAAGDTADTIATNIAAAINANARLPVTAVVNGVTLNEVDLTCPWKGETGNDISLVANYYKGQVYPAGVTLAFTAMSGGTDNPSLASLIAAMGDEWFNVMVNPYTDAANYALLQPELVSRWGGMRQIDATAYHGLRGSYSTELSFGATVNSGYMDFMSAGLAPQPGYLWAAANAAQNAFWKQQDPNLPRQTTIMSSLLPPAKSDRFIWSERNNLLFNGIATHSVDSDGTVRIERQITSYQKNAENVADTSLLLQENMDAWSYLRYDTRAYITSKYPKYKLAIDGTPIAPGQLIVTPSIIKAALVARAANVWVPAGIVMDLPTYIANLVVQINADDATRLDVLNTPRIVQGFSIFANQIQPING